MVDKHQHGFFPVLLILLVAGFGQSSAGLHEASSFFSTLNSGECVPYDNMTTYLLELEAAYTQKVQLVYNNITTEGRNLYLVIVKPYMDHRVKNPTPRNRKSYWIESGLEAKACDTVSITLAFINKLVTNCPEGYCLHDYYFVPLMNPDGHEYHRTTGVYWFKNRDIHSDFPAETYPNCLGVRLDYNFPPNSTFFGSGGTDYPCSTYYRGEGPASTKEVAEVVRLKKSAPSLTLSMTIQSEGGILTYPHSHSYEEIPDKAAYESLAQTFVRHMVDDHGLTYVAGSYSTMHTRHAGTSMDFWYHEQPSCYSYTLFIEHDSIQGNVNMFAKAQKYIGGVLAMIGMTDGGGTATTVSTTTDSDNASTTVSTTTDGHSASTTVSTTTDGDSTSTTVSTTTDGGSASTTTAPVTTT